MSTTIKVEKVIKEIIELEVSIDDVIEAINLLPMKHRWNYVGQLLNEISLGAEDLDILQKEKIRDYLKRKLNTINQGTEA